MGKWSQMKTLYPTKEKAKAAAKRKKGESGVKRTRYVKRKGGYKVKFQK